MMTKSKVTVFSLGQTEGNMTDNGLMVSKKESVSTTTLRVNLDMEGGQMVKELHGYKKLNIIRQWPILTSTTELNYYKNKF